jgi:hypothetical protein
MHGNSIQVSEGVERKSVDNSLELKELEQESGITEGKQDRKQDRHLFNRERVLD